jgi:hypothetical protein
MKHPLRFVLFTLVIIVLGLIYVQGSLLLIESRMPSHNDAPYAISWTKYDGVWLLPEWHLLFSKGTVTLDETGATYEVSGFWKREGIDWVYCPEAAKFETKFKTPEDKLRMFFGSKRSDN